MDRSEERRHQETSAPRNVSRGESQGVTRRASSCPVSLSLPSQTRVSSSFNSTPQAQHGPGCRLGRQGPQPSPGGPTLGRGRTESWTKRARTPLGRGTELWERRCVSGTSHPRPPSSSSRRAPSHHTNGRDQCGSLWTTLKAACGTQKKEKDRKGISNFFSNHLLTR